MKNILKCFLIVTVCVVAFASNHDVPFENIDVPPVIMNKVSDNEILLEYGTNADNSVFFIETQNKETKDVFVRMWKDGIMIVNEQKS